MLAILRHPIRVLVRSLWLTWQFTVAAADYGLTVAFRKPGSLHYLRGQWLQRNSRRVLRVFDVAWGSSGPVPERGLLVCNHLSYVDVLAIAAVTPTAFVAKREVRGWPVFGWFAKIAGTVFVHREKRTDVSRASAEIKEAIDSGVLLVLFAEGTSSNGETVLPFKSALLEPVVALNCPLSAGLVAYTIADGDVREDVYYWRDMTLVPHLLNLMTKRNFSVNVSFTPVPEPAADRKELARQLHAEVLRMKKS